MILRDLNNGDILCVTHSVNILWSGRKSHTAEGGDVITIVNVLGGMDGHENFVTVLKDGVLYDFHKIYLSPLYFKKINDEIK
jgi:hypothetical protein